ncbi:hypothetical protein Sjap_015454 [Stephania japonica]|uniref:Uncharacterized protein n=1 Tax=Stephania japonica TaxID=461633 RepID=A0AAP0IL24_9MAGN
MSSPISSNKIESKLGISHQNRVSPSGTLGGPLSLFLRIEKKISTPQQSLHD